jgi:hypothetical protein
MNLYLISQTENIGYDVYDSAIVAAESEEKAKLINPDKYNDFTSTYSSWCSSADLVKVTYIGIAAEGITTGVILASFNAG